MLNEYKEVRQHAGEAFRRLFWDDYLQLYLWFDDHQRIVGFELSYDLSDDFRAFRWNPDTGVVHYRVDDGESRAMKKGIPILRQDRSAVDPSVLAELVARSESLEPEIARLVTTKLEEFLAHHSADPSEHHEA